MDTYKENDEPALEKNHEEEDERIYHDEVVLQAQEYFCRIIANFETADDNDMERWLLEIADEIPSVTKNKMHYLRGYFNEVINTLISGIYFKDSVPLFIISAFFTMIDKLVAQSIDYISFLKEEYSDKKTISQLMSMLLDDKTIRFQEEYPELLAKIINIIRNGCRSPTYCLYAHTCFFDSIIENAINITGMEGEWSSLAIQKTFGFITKMLRSNPSDHEICKSIDFCIMAFDEEEFINISASTLAISLNEYTSSFFYAANVFEAFQANITHIDNIVIINFYSALFALDPESTAGFPLDEISRQAIDAFDLEIPKEVVLAEESTDNHKERAIIALANFIDAGGEVATEFACEVIEALLNASLAVKESLLVFIRAFCEKAPADEVYELAYGGHGIGELIESAASWEDALDICNAVIRKTLPNRKNKGNSEFDKGKIELDGKEEMVDIMIDFLENIDTNFNIDEKSAELADVLASNIQNS